MEGRKEGRVWDPLRVSYSNTLLGPEQRLRIRGNLWANSRMALKHKGGTVAVGSSTQADNEKQGMGR